MLGLIPSINDTVKESAIFRKHANTRSNTRSLSLKQNVILITDGALIAWQLT